MPDLCLATYISTVSSCNFALVLDGEKEEEKVQLASGTARFLSIRCSVKEKEEKRHSQIVGWNFFGCILEVYVGL